MDLSTPGADLLGAHESVLLATLGRLQGRASGRYLERLAGITSHAGAQRALRRLVQTGVVTATPTSATIDYEANRRHVLWPALESLVASPRARLDGIIVDVVGEKCGPTTSALLFGSVARGDSDVASDIDVLIVFPSDLVTEARWAAIDELHDRLEPLFGNKLQIVDVERADLERMAEHGDPLLRSWQLESVLLAGPLPALLRRHDSVA